MPRVLSKFLSEFQKEISGGSRNKTEGQSFLSDRAAEGTLRVIERAVEAQPCEMQKMSDGKETMVDEQQ